MNLYNQTRPQVQYASLHQIKLANYVLLDYLCATLPPKITHKTYIYSILIKQILKYVFNNVITLKFLKSQKVSKTVLVNLVEHIYYFSAYRTFYICLHIFRFILWNVKIDSHFIAFYNHNESLN